MSERSRRGSSVRPEVADRTYVSARHLKVMLGTAEDPDRATVIPIQTRHPSTAFAAGSELADVLRRGSAQCGVELFAAYGIKLAPAPPLPPATSETAFLSIGGFAGPCFAGFFILGANESVLRRCNSTRSSSSDWIAELGNQLLGRIKNCFVREGIPVHRVPPAVVQASVPSALHLHPGMESVKLTDERDAIWLWIEWEMDGAAAFGSVLPPSETDVLVEGAAVLF